LERNLSRFCADLSNAWLKGKLKEDNADISRSGERDQIRETHPNSGLIFSKKRWTLHPYYGILLLKAMGVIMRVVSGYEVNLIKQQYNTALYFRLSRDDELKGESGSISTQRDMLTQY